MFDEWHDAMRPRFTEWSMREPLQGRPMEVPQSHGPHVGLNERCSQLHHWSRMLDEVGAAHFQPQGGLRGAWLVITIE